MSMRNSVISVLIGSFICTLLNPVVMGFYSFTVFFESLSAELRWGHGVLGLAITVGTLSTAVLAPIAGRLADRGGARKVIVASTVGLAVMLGIMPWACTTLPTLYLAFAALGVIAAGYFVALPRIIASWFDARRGLALGLVLSASGLGSALMAPVATAVIERAGWQLTYLVLAAAVLVIALPVALLLVHEAPRPTASAGRPLDPPARLRIDRPIIMLAVAFFCCGAGLHGVLINFAPMLLARGIDAEGAASFFAVTGVAMFAGRIFCGVLLDYFPANRVGVVFLLGSAAGILLLQHGEGNFALIVGAALFGLGISAETDVLGYIISRLYPIESFSRYYAVPYSGFMIGTSLGPPLIGGLFDLTREYTAAAIVASAMTALSALVLAAMAKTPTRSAHIMER